jgi:excisionase family DNA binding protein
MQLYCSIIEAAAALGVKRSTIYRLLEDKKLKAVKLGTRRLVSIASIRELAASLESRAA